LFANGSLSDPAKNEILVPPKITIPDPLAIKKQTFSRSEHQALRNEPPLAVARLPRTAATWGITGLELNRLNNAVQFMDLHCERGRCDLWLLTTARATPRSLIADVWKRITRLQGMYRLRCYSVITFESRGGLHAHIIFLGSSAIAERLKASDQFGTSVDIQAITDAKRLVRKYLVKERTPQAGYGREYILGGRIRGSHRFQAAGIVCAFLANWSAMPSRRPTSSRGNTATPSDQLKKSTTGPAHAVRGASGLIAGAANERTSAAFRLVSSAF
jgi:hypothetical protein